jgi:hypothetical protein
LFQSGFRLPIIWRDMSSVTPAPPSDGAREFSFPATLHPGVSAAGFASAFLAMPEISEGQGRRQCAESRRADFQEDTDDSPVLGALDGEIMVSHAPRRYEGLPGKPPLHGIKYSVSVPQPSHLQVEAV